MGTTTTTTTTTTTANYKAPKTNPQQLQNTYLAEQAAAPKGGFLSREFVARRISEGETGRLKEELKCQACGKGYKHISSLAKHLWEHTPEWNVTSKLLISKHQQVQLLEAASILVSMNEEEAKDAAASAPSGQIQFSTPNYANQLDPQQQPISVPPPSIPMASSTRPISKSHYQRRGSVSGNSPHLMSGFHSYHNHHVHHHAHHNHGPHHHHHHNHHQHRSSISGTHLSGSVTGRSPVVTDSLLTQDYNLSASLSSVKSHHPTGAVDDYEALASPYQRSRRMSHLRNSPAMADDDEDDLESFRNEHSSLSPPDDDENDGAVFGEMD
ncbi:hypothetical protein TRVA0_020S02608 [Trichomonascus vanleenenianus]|uniref:uncharacterized protein n=1 Tax=Trichomonascus vanleenenianus TaxID=2268995 RepID=UPI003EC9C567